MPERLLFWRYKFLGQRAVVLGDWKYFRINGRELLFDHAADPIERANLRSALFSSSGSRLLLD